MMGQKTLSPKDWTLLVIAAAEGKDVSPVQLQKALFLLGEKLELPAESRYQFSAYDYGPFSKAVYDDAERLEHEGFIFVEHGAPYRRYFATPAGLGWAQGLRAQLDPKAVDYLDRLIAWVRSLSFKALVEAVYAEYPDMRANSVFRS